MEHQGADQPGELRQVQLGSPRRLQTIYCASLRSAGVYVLRERLTQQLDTGAMFRQPNGRLAAPITRGGKRRRDVEHSELVRRAR